MQIECPSCASINKIEFGANVVCSECKKSFSGYLYKKVGKPVMATTTALFVGAFGMYKAEQLFFENNRYPIPVEYEIIDGCINSSHKLMSEDDKIKKTKICICGLEQVMTRMSYKELEKSGSDFITRFRSGISKCR
jgi:hypothetical protein